MIIENFFIELSLIVIIALAIALIARLLKQPLIISYIIAGLIIGPTLLNVLQSGGNLEIFSKLGVTLLLFTVGLNLNPRAIKEVGNITLIAGFIQMAVTAIIIFLISRFFSFSFLTSLYIAIALSFSSTIIVLKILTDEEETESLHGKIAIGILIMQDIIAIIALMLISSFAGKTNVLASIGLGTLLEGGALIAIIFVTSYYILPPLTRFAAKSQELLLLFSVGWCLALAGAFYYLNFSMEIGALLAGVTLSLSPYRYEMSARLKPIRDFFLLIFFIALGSKIIFTNLYAQIAPILIFSLVVFIIKPLTVISTMGIMGYTKRNSFLTSLPLSQISEFSFILIALAVSMNQIPPETIPLVTVIGLITIAGSSYEMIYSKGIYNRLSKFLIIFEKRGKKVDELSSHSETEHEIILFGYNRIGYNLLESIKKMKKKYLVVDYNPSAIISLTKEKIECRYGDAGDTELLDELNLSKAKMIISTIPDFETNILLIKKVRSSNKNAVLIAVSHQIEEALKLYEAGATYVIMPHFLGAHHTSTLIEEYGLNPKKFLQEKKEDMKNLQARRKIGHEHPRYEAERK